MESSEEAKRKLKTLIALLKMYSKKLGGTDANLSFLSNEEKTMSQGIDFLINNMEALYNEIDKDHSKISTFEKMLDPMISMMTEELKEQLDLSLDEMEELREEIGGDVENIDYTTPVQESTNKDTVPTVDQLLEQTDASIPMKHRVMMAIQQVDERLKDVEVGTELADNLLDRRIELLAQLKELS